MSEATQVLGWTSKDGTRLAFSFEHVIKKQVILCPAVLLGRPFSNDSPVGKPHFMMGGRRVGRSHLEMRGLHSSFKKSTQASGFEAGDNNKQ